MTRIYQPDEWVMLKIHSEKWGTIYKVFGGWYGSFATGDSWKLSSGTVKATITTTKKMSGDIRVLHFLQETGSTYSVYQCYSGNIKGWRALVLESIIEKIKSMGATVEVMPDDTDFEAIEYPVARLNHASN